MNPNGSVLTTILDRLRHGTENPDAQDSDAMLLSNYVCPSIVDVLARLNLSSQARIVLSHQFTFDEDEAQYLLPPSIQEVIRVVITDEEDNIVGEIVPHEPSNVMGGIWRLEGPPGAMLLTFDGASVSTSTFHVLYIPNGDSIPHKGDGTLSTSSGVSTFQLDATPTLGFLDRRPNALAGMLLRLLPAAPAAIEVAQIEASYLSGGQWHVRTRLPMGATPGSFPYEIVPNGMQSFMDAVTWHAAVKLSPARRLSNSTVVGLERNYRQAMKTLGDNLAHAQTRRTRYIERRTADNPGTQMSPPLFVLNN